MEFRRGRGTIDATYILKLAIGREIEKEKGKVLQIRRKRSKRSAMPW